MLNFNSLRQRLFNGLVLALPIGLAVAVHGVWIGVSGRLHQGRAAPAKPAVDNTPQLVRITRRAVQQQRVAAVSLDLSSSLPPPPPELLLGEGESLPPDPESDCPPVTAESAVLKPGDEGAEAAMPVPSAPVDGPSAVSQQGDDAVRTLPSPEPDELPQIWRRALGVPIWPRQLGEKPASAQFREVSRQDLEGRSIQELNQQSFAVGEDIFRFLRLGDRLLILRQPSQP